VLRIWDEARTSHFELLANMAESRFIYRKQNYSFDQELADSISAKRFSFVQTCTLIARGQYDYLELNEPTMVKIWPALACYAAIVRIRRALGIGATTVLYAIDNLDSAAAFVQRTHLPTLLGRALYKAVFSWLLGAFDRVAFGTAGAAVAYQLIAPKTLRSLDTATIEQVPSACGCGALTKVPGRVSFIGSLEARKGISELVEAWPLVVSQAPSATLRIIGKGKLRDSLLNWSKKRSEVTFIEDPPRSVVHDELRSAGVVVLLSQPDVGWREQIGLPIVEGLAHGCEIVASDETGIAQWLAKNEHRVVAAHATPSVTAHAIVDALLSSREPAAIISHLPERHGRSIADDWLLR
jgi:glycosyltransferase involved in cell wall biosynthesis